MNQPRMSSTIGPSLTAGPRDKSEVEDALQNLFAELDCLTSEICEFERKLGPVLVPQSPDKECGYPSKTAGSMVMGQLRELRSNIGMKRNMVKSLTARAEL